VSYTLRHANPEDFEFCYRLNEVNFRCLVEELRGWDDAAERAAMHEQFRPRLDAIIQLEGRDVGHLGVVEHFDHVELRMIALLPEVQGCGVGTSVIRDLLRDARSRNKPVSLSVTERNTGAIRLYNRLGFVPVYTFDQSVKGVRKVEMIAAVDAG